MPKCLIFETPDAEGHSPGTSDAFRINCRRCGEFDVLGTAMAMLPNALSKGIHRRALMSHTIRRMTGLSQSRSPMIVSNKLESYWGDERLPTPSTQAEQLVLLAGDTQLSPDQPI